MADISKIKLPGDSTTYNIKDTTARSQSGVTGVKGNAESSYRTGQVNLTPNNIGAVGRTSELLTTNPFAPETLKGPYISKIDNAFYCADKRWDVSITNVSGNVGSLFDGDYEGGAIINGTSTAIVSFDFANGVEATGYFPGYPYGNIIVNFYYVAGPETVTGRVYCNYSNQGVGWHDITFTKVTPSATGAITYIGRNNYHQISKLEISIKGDTSNSYGYTRISEIEMHLDRPMSNKTPFLSKYGAETLYYNLTAPRFLGDLTGNVTGNATNVTGTVAIANGGTSASTAVTALTNIQNRGRATNLNDAKSRGCYYFSNTATNQPVDGRYGEIVNVLNDEDTQNDSSNWLWQICFNTANTDIYVRNKINAGGFSSWHKLFNSNNVIPIANGGTGQSTAKAGANALLGGLDNTAAQSTDFTDNTSIITTNTSGTTGTYYHRKASLMWNYIKTKISSVLGLTATNYGGTSAKATADASGNTITTYYAPKSTAVTNVALATNKITKTINGTTTDVVTSATTSAYGITKLSTSTSSTATDVAATPSAVKTAYDLANTANGTANTALSGVNGNLIYDHTYTISNGVATFTPHVYQKGTEVTTNYASSCFTWKYRLIDGSEVSLTTKSNRGCDVTITNLGYGGNVIGLFTPA